MKLEEAYVEIRTDMALLDKGLKEVHNRAVTAATRVESAFSKISFKNLLYGSFGLYAIVRGFKALISPALNFEVQMANVSTMLEKTAMSILPQFVEGVERLSIKFGEATASLTKGLYDILSASVAPEKALEVLEVASKAATAGITSTGVAAYAVVTILNSYQMAADQAGKVSDILFAIVKRGLTTFAELAPAIGKVAATAAKVGLPFEELGAIIATVTRAGISTDETMTAIGGVLRSFLSPTEEAKKAVKEFGVELNTTTIKSIGLIGAMGKLEKATVEQLAEIFPNIRGLKGIISAMGDVKNYASDLRLMLNSLGLTQEAYNKMSDTTVFQLGRVKQLITLLTKLIGQEFLPYVREAAENKIKWYEANKKLVTVEIAEWAKRAANAVKSFGEFVKIHGKTILLFFEAIIAAKIIFGIINLGKAIWGLNVAVGALVAIAGTPAWLAGMFAFAVGTSLYYGIKEIKEHFESISKLDFKNVEIIPDTFGKVLAMVPGGGFKWIDETPLVDIEQTIENLTGSIVELKKAGGVTGKSITDFFEKAREIGISSSQAVDMYSKALARAELILKKPPLTTVPTITGVAYKAGVVLPPLYKKEEVYEYGIAIGLVMGKAKLEAAGAVIDLQRVGREGSAALMTIPISYAEAWENAQFRVLTNFDTMQDHFEGFSWDVVSAWSNTFDILNDKALTFANLFRDVLNALSRELARFAAEKLWKTILKKGEEWHLGEYISEAIKLGTTLTPGGGEKIPVIGAPKRAFSSEEEERSAGKVAFGGGNITVSLDNPSKELIIGIVQDNIQKYGVLRQNV